MLELKNISKIYKTGENSVQALNNVSLNFSKSEFVSILGASGCGKTTLLNIIGGLDKYTSGDLIIDGVSTKNYADRDWDTYRNHKIGFVFQSYNLIHHLSVLENVEMALTLNGIGKQERKEEAIKALKRVGLESQIHKMPNQLSGGQMQRVAIARAIVNKPTIVLADEPTGALDTKTSVQVMDILKEISKDTLIIMVTHNPDLAKQYSTRTIELKDGEVIGDNSQEDNVDVKNKKTIHKEHKGKKRTSMSFFTALYLSFKNFLHKKGRTFLTSFAGSIGIIGVALVLAISNGFTAYINNLQSDTLSGYPVSISTATVDYDKLNSFTLGSDDDVGTIEDEVMIYNPLQQYVKYGHYNYMGEEFVNYVKNYEEQDRSKGENSNLHMVQYTYFTPLKLINKTKYNTYSFIENKNITSIMSGSSNGDFYEELSNEEFMLDSYEVIYTNNYDKNDKYGLTLVVDKGNKLSLSTAISLGIDFEYGLDGTCKNVDFATITDKEYKLISNDQYYISNSIDFENITSFEKANTSDQATLSALYNSAESKTLKVTRILRVKEDATNSILTSGIMYKPELATEYRQECENSVIARKQETRQLTDDFYAHFEFNVSEFVGTGLLPINGFANIDQINAFLGSSYGFTLTPEEAYEMGMQQIGISKIAQNISLYAKSFDAKEEVSKMIDEYNALQTEDYHKIIFSDTTSFLASSLGTLINAISYVLIAFASISLLVSSIMIGIITYVSVIERTKEIGVLRSLGARKIDVSRVFNAETLIIGFLAGIIGIGISYLLCPIISLIVNSVTSGAVARIAILNPLHALSLVAISMILTLISGSIPSAMASKKDPVEALRSE